jgi:hypothetical protein
MVGDLWSVKRAKNTGANTHFSTNQKKDMVFCFSGIDGFLIGAQFIRIARL